MREPPEPRHDVPMMFRPCLHLGPERPAQDHRPLLVREPLGMREGQIEEHPQLRFAGPVMPGAQRLLGCLVGCRVRGIHPRLSAEGVARILVEKKDQRERTLRGRQPARKPACRRGLVGFGKALAEAPVEGGILREPSLGSRFRPEPDDFARLKIDARRPQGQLVNELHWNASVENAGWIALRYR